MATTKLTTTSNEVKVNINGDSSTKVNTSSSKVSVDVKSAKVDVSLARVGPQGASATLTISEATDIELNNLANNDGLIYNSSTQKWVNHKFATTSLSDIDNTNKQDGSVLLYKSSTEKYTATNSIEDNMTISGGTF